MGARNLLHGYSFACPGRDAHCLIIAKAANITLRL